MPLRAHTKFLTGSDAVVLTTSLGSLRYSTSEFHYYQSLFKLIDIQDADRVSTAGAFVERVLHRTGIPPNAIHSMIQAAKACVSDDTAEEIDLNVWLVLCKLLAHHQHSKLEWDPLDETIQSIHSAHVAKWAEFHLFGVHEDSVACPALDAQVRGWKVYEEGLQNQHVKFRILVRISIPGRQTPFKLKIERRYSEFESISAILQKSFRGCLVTPLPQKSWSMVAPTPAFMLERAQELQLFLFVLIHHRILSRSFELHVFLQGSSAGWAAYNELYLQRQAASTASSEDKMSSSSTLQNLVGAVAQSRAVGLLSSLWGSVTKNIQQNLGPPFVAPTVPSPPLLPVVQIYADNVAALSKRLDRMFVEPKLREDELVRAAHHLKQVVGNDSGPSTSTGLRVLLDKAVTTGAHAQKELEAAASSAATLRYVARFAESLRVATEDYNNHGSALQQSQQRVRNMREKVDELESSLRKLSAEQSGAARSSIDLDIISSGYSCERQPPQGDASCDRLPVELDQARKQADRAAASYQHEKQQFELNTKWLLGDCATVRDMQQASVLRSMANFVECSATKSKLEAKFWEDLLQVLST